MVGKNTKVALHRVAVPRLCAAFGAGAAFLTSCSGATEASSSDASVAVPDAAEASVAADGGAADAGGEAAASCDLGAQPTLPAITSEVIIAGADGGTPPAPTGGDEDGVWAYTKITLYLAAAAQGQIDPAASTIDGKGFIELHAGRFRQLADTTTVLSTTAVGKVTRAGVTKALGTYASASPALTFTVECHESTGDPGGLGTVAFSRVDATHGRLHVTTMTQIGTATLVIELARQP